MADKITASNKAGGGRTKSVNREGDGYGYNCFVNEKIEDYWWPKLVEAVKKREESNIISQ